MPPSTWKTPIALAARRTMVPVTSKPWIGWLAGAEGAEGAANVTRDAPVGVFVAEGEATCDSV